ncbi:hypothetical protein B0H14DRAFT_2602871 [Mycena olivaceomarginata]|nr:hypothetical protein B0H14DRAFT_2602871 [Mycena olivaceomarginata]
MDPIYSGREETTQLWEGQTYAEASEKNTKAIASVQLHASAAETGMQKWQNLLVSCVTEQGYPESALCVLLQEMIENPHVRAYPRGSPATTNSAYSREEIFRESGENGENFAENLGKGALNRSLPPLFPNLWQGIGVTSIRMLLAKANPSWKELLEGIEFLVAPGHIREFAQSHQSNWWLLSPVCRTVIQLELATMQSSPQGLYMVARRPREMCWLQRKISHQLIWWLFSLLFIHTNLTVFTMIARI